MAKRSQSSTATNMEGRRGSKKRGLPSINLADVNIESDESSGGEHDNASAPISSDDDNDDNDDNETNLAAKKVRMARAYLERVEAAEDQDSGEDDDDNDDDNEDDEVVVDDHDTKISRRLRDRRLEQTGALETLLADKIAQNLSARRSSTKPPPVAAALTTESSTAPDISASSSSLEKISKAWVAQGHVQMLRGHDLSPTCVALQNDASKALSGSKDHSVILWDMETSRKISFICPHWKTEDSHSTASRTDGQVLSVACSHDGRYAAVGSRNAVVRIFDIRVNNNHNHKRASSSNESSAAPSPSSKNNLVKEFRGHKGAITSLCFQEGTMQLFSASDDRCIRSYNLNEMVQLETLYGHQLGVTSIDCSQKERPVSVGRDRTARAWKLAEDTHMIYRGGSLMQPSECVSVLKEDWFLTGHEDGQLSLWLTEKKKPVVSWNHAHGWTAHGIARSIVSMAAVRRSDLAMTGSCDGFLRLWKVQTGSSKAEGREITECGQVPIHGYINGIAIAPNNNAKFAVLAVGNEHRLGRWDPVPRAKNCLAIVKLAKPEDR
ncbi:hypothetical protein ACA910_012132 [Epithemia clementina (nom. ined.)]